MNSITFKYTLGSNKLMIEFINALTERLGEGLNFSTDAANNVVVVDYSSKNYFEVSNELDKMLGDDFTAEECRNPWDVIDDLQEVNKGLREKLDYADSAREANYAAWQRQEQENGRVRELIDSIAVQLKNVFPKAV